MKKIITWAILLFILGVSILYFGFKKSSENETICGKIFSSVSYNPCLKIIRTNNDVFVCPTNIVTVETRVVGVTEDRVKEIVACYFSQYESGIEKLIAACSERCQTDMPSHCLVFAEKVRRDVAAEYQCRYNDLRELVIQILVGSGILMAILGVALPIVVNTSAITARKRMGNLEKREKDLEKCSKETQAQMMFLFARISYSSFKKNPKAIGVYKHAVKHCIGAVDANLKAGNIPGLLSSSGLLLAMERDASKYKTTFDVVVHKRYQWPFTVESIETALKSDRSELASKKKLIIDGMNRVMKKYGWY